MSERSDSGYLWGPDNVDYAMLFRYDIALRTGKLDVEEREYHGVFHGPSYAHALTLEVTQKLRRAHVSSKYDLSTVVSTDDSDVLNEYLSNNANKLLTRSKDDYQYPSRNNVPVLSQSSVPLSEDLKLTFADKITRLVGMCNEAEKKWLAYYIVQENLDLAIPVEQLGEDMATYVKEVSEFPKFTWGTLTKYIGSRGTFNKAFNTLRDKYRQVLSGE